MPKKIYKDSFYKKSNRIRAHKKHDSFYREDRENRKYKAYKNF